MPIEVVPIALAVLAPIVILALFGAAWVVGRAARRLWGLRRARRVEGLAEGAPDGADPPIEGSVGVSESSPGPARKLDGQLTRRYTGPTIAAWRQWWRAWQDTLGPLSSDPMWMNEIVGSFLSLARPIVAEMDPSPDSVDAAAAAAAARAVYLNPERYMLIDDQWVILEEVAARAQVAIDPTRRRWQIAPAVSIGDERPDGSSAAGSRRLMPPTRHPLPEGRPDASTTLVAQALAIQGLVETTGMTPPSAARTWLSWAGLLDVSDAQADWTAADAARLCQDLGLIEREE